jgi:hypothetical protein
MWCQTLTYFDGHLDTLSYFDGCEDLLDKDRNISFIPEQN